MARTAIEQHFISEKIGAALSNAGLPHGTPIQRVLDEAAEIIGDRSSYDVVARTGDGHRVSLDERIEQLRNDPRYRAMFPAPVPTIPKSDINGMRAAFAHIASGKIRVV